MLSAGAERGQGVWRMCVVMAHVSGKVCNQKTFMRKDFFFHSNNSADYIWKIERGCQVYSRTRGNNHWPSIGCALLKLSSFSDLYHQINADVRSTLILVALSELIPNSSNLFGQCLPFVELGHKWSCQIVPKYFILTSQVRIKKVLWTRGNSEWRSKSDGLPHRKGAYMNKVEQTL